MKCIQESLSFTDTMAAVKDSVPNNVTVSYYFICMLHLANEKVGVFSVREPLHRIIIHLVFIGPRVQRQRRPGGLRNYQVDEEIGPTNNSVLEAIRLHSLASQLKIC